MNIVDMSVIAAASTNIAFQGPASVSLVALPRLRLAIATGQFFALTILPCT